MKILMINKFLHPNGGSETYIFKLGEFLISQGHEVQYFGMEHEKRVVSNRVNAYTSNMDFHGGSKLSKLTYPLKTIYSSEARKKLRLVLDDFQPDVCHLNNFNYQLTPSILLEIAAWRKKTKRKCTVVYTAHDYQLVCPNHMCYDVTTQAVCEKCLHGSAWNCAKGKCIHGSRMKSLIGTAEASVWKLKKAYRYIDRIICCSNFMKTKLDTNPLFSERTVTLHNFIEKTEQNPSKKKDYVLYFGRYSQEKGIATLLQAAKQLPEIRFVFAGSGPLEASLQDVPNIENVGFQSGETLTALIREARFSVYPSEWYENCPFSVMESQMLGTPVLGAKIGGIPELIVPDVTGELFESGNVEALKEKIQALWNDKARCQRYTEQCAKAPLNTIEDYYKRLLPIYRNER